MSKFLDFLINLLKWPAALFLALSLPGLFESFNAFNFNSLKFYAFFGGAGFYFVILVLCGYNICATMQIISHELTHILFAYLTFHSADRIRISPDDMGGSVRINSKGNWLILLAPYFFPLFSAIYMLMMPGLLRITNDNWLIYAIFGYLFFYYAATVLSQVHPGQTDIIRCGYLFSTIVIIAANLYVIGMIFSFNEGLWPGVEKYLRSVSELNREYFQNFAALIRQYFQPAIVGIK